MEQLEKIFKENGLDLALLDILEEKGKINLGEELENEENIQNEINENTECAMYYTNDFEGGWIIEK